MVRQFSWVAGGRILAAILQMVTLGIVAAWLGPADFGLVSAVLAFAVLPQTVLDLGIPTYVVRTRASADAHHLLRLAMRVNGLTSLALVMISVIALLTLGLFVAPLFLLMLPIALWVGAERNVEVWMSLALADGDARLNVAFLLGRRGLGLALMLGLFALAVQPVLAYSVAMGISSIGAAAGAYLVLKSRLSGLPRGNESLKELLRVTGAYWIHSAATQVRNLDTALVAVIGSASQAGYYALASRLTGPLRILPTSLAAVVLPRVARAHGKVGRRLSLLIWATLSIMAGLYAGLALIAPWAVPILLGDAYAPAVAPIQIVCGGLILGAAASLLAAILQGKGHQRVVATSSVVASVVCLVAIVVGTAAAGATGAAMGLVSSFAVQALLMGVVLIWLRLAQGEESR